MRTVLFDLDGTLLDTGEDIAAAANAARVTLDLAPMPTSQVLRHLGHGLGHLLEGVLPIHLHSQMDVAREAFMTYYRAHPIEETRFYPGAEAFLSDWAGPVGIVTNKPGEFTERILTGLGMRPRFDVVVSGDTLRKRKPHPAPILHALRLLSCDPKDAVFIGDSEVDMEAANAAGVLFLAVGWGRVAKDAPMRLSHFNELLEMVR